VDVELEMPREYVPDPDPGETDDVRCFVLDWPVDETMYVTGFEPVPGNRSVVHHLIVAAIEPDDLDYLPEEEGDGPAGFDCEGGFGRIPLGELVVLGGSLLGSDFPDGLGRRVRRGSKIILNVHYSTAHGGAGPDRTRLRFRLDETAREGEGMAVSNLAWLVGDGMKIDAGDPDAVFWYWYEPTLFTRGETVWLRSISAHMHYFGSRILVRILREDGSRKCLLEIPDWDFGWEQPYWFAEPVRLDPGDQLYLECHFDNSARNQPNADPPRDIAWGNDNQDMCAAFIGFTR
jgi:hypothetical protein